MFKVLTVGDSNVGKSSLLHRYVRGESLVGGMHTIGMDFYSHKNNNGVTDAILWDTGGMERFDCICKSYYAGAHAIVIVYDVIDDPVGAGAAKWYNKVAANVQGLHKVPITIIGNKVDQKDKLPDVLPPVLLQLTAHENIRHEYTSAITGVGVDDTFNDIMSRLAVDIPSPLRHRHEESRWIARRHAPEPDTFNGGCWC